MLQLHLRWTNRCCRAEKNKLNLETELKYCLKGLIND
jgi:hypothetical protein